MSMDKYLEALNSTPDFTKKIEEKHLTPAELKKREEVAKSMEKENPGMPMGKKMAIATSVAKRVAEAVVGTKPKTEKEKKLAAMSGDKNTITHGDVLKARGVTKEEVTQEEVEQIDELNKDTMLSYISKAVPSVGTKERVAKGLEVNADRAKTKAKKVMYSNSAKTWRDAAARRVAGIHTAAKKIAKEEVEHIEEEALGDYAKLRNYADKRGGMDKKDFHTAANHIESGNVSALKRHLNKMDTDPRDKVLDHVKKAHWGKLGYSSMNEESEQVEENTLSAKAGRAGEDLGAPGKNFAKIAAKAGKKYGSKEAGKRVAGAILAKMRAKASK